MRYLSLILFFIAIPFLSFAQETASVSGYILNAESGEKLISANFSLIEMDKGTSTDTTGYFDIEDIEPGSYTAVATYVGYQRFKKEISIEAGDTLQLNIKLLPERYQLKEVVVNSQDRAERKINMTSIETDFIKDTPTAFQADVFRSIQALPGVKAASDFSSGLYIRGGSPDQTLIQLDNSTIYNPSHFFGFFSTFNPDAVEDIQLHKGGYPAKYGGRLGSVLSISNKTGNTEEFKGSVTLGMLASRASFEGPIKNGSWMLSFRRSTMEPLLNYLRDSEYRTIPTRFDFMDVNAKLQYDLNKSNQLSASFYSGRDNLELPFAEDANINLNYGNQLASISWRHTFADNLVSNFTVTGSHYFSYPSFNIAATPFERSNHIYDLATQGDITYQPNNNHRISSGYNLGLLKLKLRDDFNHQEKFSSKTQAQYGSWYIQDKWNITDRWTLTPGLRLNGFSEGNYLRLSPRVSLEYHPSDRIQFQMTYGRYHQFLTQFSHEAFSGFDVWLPADEGIPPSYGNQYVFGINTFPWEGYKFDVEVYYRSMMDLFEPNPFIPDRAEIPYKDMFHFGEGYAYGAELLFRRSIGQLNGFIGYTFSITRRKFPTYNNSASQNNQAEFYPPRFHRLHDLNVALEYKFNESWSTSATFNYASGQAYTKPLGKARAKNMPISPTPKKHFISGRPNASRLPPYHRLDIGVKRKGTFFGIGEAKWKLQVVNAYSRRNIWFYNYEIKNNSTERNSVSLLPVLPSISYTLDF